MSLLELVKILRQDYGRGLIFGVIGGIAIGSLGTIYLRLDHNIAEMNRIETGKIPDLENNINLLNVNILSLKHELEKKDAAIAELHQEIGLMRAKQPVDSTILTEPDKPATILGDLKMSLYLTPDIRDDGSFNAKISSPIFGNQAYMEVRSSEPREFTYNGKIYHMIVNPVRPITNVKSIRVRIFQGFADPQ